MLGAENGSVVIAMRPVGPNGQISSADQFFVFVLANSNCHFQFPDIDRVYLPKRTQMTPTVCINGGNDSVFMQSSCVKRLLD